MSKTAAEIMTANPATVTPQASVAEIFGVLAARHISGVPVCNPDGTLAGLVSEADVLRPFRETARAKRDWWLGLLAEGEDMPQAFLDYLRLDTRSASDVMVRHVVTAAEDMTVPELADLMINHNVKRLPVLRDGKLIGIVSRADLVAAIAQTPGLLV